MAKKKEGIARLKLTITEEPDGLAYVHFTGDISMQLAVQDLTVVDLRQPRTGGAQVVVARKAGEASEQ